MVWNAIENKLINMKIEVEKMLAADPS